MRAAKLVTQGRFQTPLPPKSILPSAVRGAGVRGCSPDCGCAKAPVESCSAASTAAASSVCLRFIMITLGFYESGLALGRAAFDRCGIVFHEVALAGAGEHALAGFGQDHGLRVAFQAAVACA